MENEGKYGISVALSMVVGIVVGVGIFFKSSEVIKVANFDPTIVIAAWVLGGIISITGGLTAAEIGAAIPRTGGIIEWFRVLYGDKPAFFVGWLQAVLYCPALIAVVAYYFAKFLFELIGTTATNTQLIIVAFIAITFSFSINLFTNKLGGYIQVVATIIKLLPLILITLLGLFLGDNPEVFAPGPSSLTSAPKYLILGSAIVPVMFAFDGWIYVGTIAGDFKNVKRDLPRSIILGLGFITIFYALLNYSMLKVFDITTLESKGISGIAENFIGPIGAKFVLSAIVVSAYGILNGFTLASSKMFYTLAEEGHIPFSNTLKKVSKNQQCVNSGILMYFITLIYLAAFLFIEKASSVGDVAVAIFWIFYTILFFGIFILRSKKHANLVRPYKVPLFPIIPIIAIVGGASIAIYATIDNPLYMAISIVIVALGCLFYRDKTL